MSTGGIGNAVSSVLSFTIIGKLFEAKAPKPTTQRIGELAQQTAKEGEPRPIVWGRVRPISGNIMHSSTPRIITREVKGRSRGGGKGGKKKQPKQYEERVFRTYAIRICEGPITAIIRVWRNNKLVYDARGNAWGAKNNGVFLRRARFYLGGWTQMPDPTLESQWGVGNVPAYRGTCYMVVPDEDLTDMGGSVPQYIFEVERAEGVALTSRPYALENFDAVESGAPSARTSPSYYLAESLDSLPVGIVGGELKAPLLRYDLKEGLDSLAVVDSGSLRKVRVTYSAVEGSDSSALIQSGTLKKTVIEYNNYPVEATESAPASIVGGVL